MLRAVLYIIISSTGGNPARTSGATIYDEAGLCTMSVICSQHILELGLVDPAAAKDETLGHIRLCIRISSPSAPDVAPSREKHKSSSSNLWNSVLTVTLLEGSNLPSMDQNGGCGLQWRVWPRGRG